MFNKSKGFKRAVKTFYDNLLQKGKDIWKTKNKTPSTFEHDDAVLNPFLTEDLDALALNRIGLMFENLYITRVDSLFNENWLDGYGKKYEESDHYDDIENTIRGLINSCIDEYNKAVPENPISKRDYVQLTKATIKIICDKISNPLWRKINNSIQKDMQDYEKAMQFSDNPYDLNEYLVKNQTKDNRMFKFRNKTYYNKLDNLDELGIGQSVISEIFNMFHKINYERRQKEVSMAYNLSGSEWNIARKEIASLVKWVDEYGMSNNDEIWATGVEKFLKLEPEHRKEILKLMSVNDGRELPNRTQRNRANRQVP
jgi:hypothetical protein